MDSRKVLFFLNILRTEATNRNGLAKHYENAVKADDAVIKLTSFLNDYTFFQGIGSSMYERAKELLDELFQNPSEALLTLQKVRQLNETIQNEISFCSERLQSPSTFTDPITVLRKKDRIAYLKTYGQIASTCVYLIAIYEEVSSLKNLAWAETDGIQESAYAVNTIFLPALLKIKKPPYSWVIRKKKIGGDALFEGEAFFIKYEDSYRVETLCDSLHKEAMGTHSFLNIRAFEADELDVPYCWGTGNLVSFSPRDALQLLHRDVVTKLRSPSKQELRYAIPAPLECARILADNKEFCISPDELTNAMNQWIMGHEIEKRKKNHFCLFCGKPVPADRLICKTHFFTEFK